MENRGKRPRFSVSMMLELMSEVWVMRERMYALEKVVEEAGLPVAEKLEAWQPNEAEAKELDEQRNRMIKSVLRSLEANHVPGLHLRRSLDAAAEAAEDGEQLTDVVRAA
jgi:septation ring formation regulator EzrA